MIACCIVVVGCCSAARWCPSVLIMDVYGLTGLGATSLGCCSRIWCVSARNHFIVCFLGSTGHSFDVMSNMLSVRASVLYNIRNPSIATEETLILSNLSGSSTSVMKLFADPIPARRSLRPRRRRPLRLGLREFVGVVFALVAASSVVGSGILFQGLSVTLLFTVALISRGSGRNSSSQRDCHLCDRKERSWMFDQRVRIHRAFLVYVYWTIMEQETKTVEVTPVAESYIYRQRDVLWRWRLFLRFIFRQVRHGGAPTLL